MLITKTISVKGSRVALRVMREKTAKQKKKMQPRRETNEKFLKNLSDHRLTDSQVSILSNGLRFIPTPVKGKKRKRTLFKCLVVLVLEH